MTSGRTYKMSNVTEIHRGKDKLFTKEEVQALMPLLRTLSHDSNNEVQKIRDTQRFYIKTGAPQLAVTEQDNKIGIVLQKFFTKIKALGGTTISSGWIAFNYGNGYFIWRHANPELLWTIGYNLDPELFRRPA